jgi:hypothetical protein
MTLMAQMISCNYAFPLELGVLEKDGQRHFQAGKVRLATD